MSIMAGLVNAAIPCNIPLLLLFFLTLPLRIKTSELDPDYQGESAVSAVSGSRALLPCDLKSPMPGDNVYLVLWYRDDSGLPIYTLDARRTDDLSLADHRADDPSLGRRAYFLTVGDPPSLSIEDPDMLDEGVYICRVDFRESPTRYTRVNLTIIVPPKSIKLVDDSNEEVSTITKPYNEGQPLRLICIVSGGRPAPRVLWFLQSSLIDDTYYTSNGIVRNELVIADLRRDYLLKQVTCQANNNNQTVPLYARVTLDLNLPPLSVEFLNKDSRFSSGYEYTLTCKATGSRPPATMTWWKGRTRLHVDSTPVVSPDGSTATSRLLLKVHKNDHGKFIKCRATNQLFPHIQLEDGAKLQIHYAPEVEIVLGSSLSPDDIKVGDDVYFECRVVANPPIHKLLWFHEGKSLRQDLKRGIITSNQSLVIQRLDRKAGGNYHCVGENLEGSASSQKLQLEVKYPPECDWDREPTYAVALQEEVEIQCRVVADPRQIRFKWAFNSTSGFTEVPKAIVLEEGTTSLLKYTPTSTFHFGTLLCWGENDVGRQKKPCMFHVTQAGPPEPPINCTLGNETWNSFHVLCVSGYDGGVAQVFISEIYEEAQLQQNLTSSTTPKFSVPRLKPNSDYTVIVYAANKKGRSQKVRLDGRTRSAVEKQIGGMSVFSVSPVLATLIGVICGLVIAALGVAVCIRTGRSKRGMKRLATKPASQSQSVPPPQLTEPEDKNPDVVPYNNSDFPDKRFVWHYPETSSFPEMSSYQKVNNFIPDSSPTYSETDL